MFKRLLQLTLALSLACPAYLTAAANISETTDLPETLLTGYQENLEILSRELNAAKEHRTAIISRMDDIGHQLSGLEAQVRTVIDREPTLREGIAGMDSRIERVEQEIADTDKTLHFISNQLNNLPSPTLLEDALGKSPQKRRQRAVKEYQRFKAKGVLAELMLQKRELVSTRELLVNSINSIEVSVDKLHTKRRHLEQKRKNLETRFVSLSTDVVQKQDRFSQLQNRLDAIIADPGQARFFNARGHLPAPTSGHLRHTFAEPKAKGLLKWEGIVINAPMGQEVTAVFDGKVVFADHMQGLGNVAIVDHGEGFMSLYGMTDFLIVEPGQVLLAGDTIGTVGTTTGSQKPGLYFEIRQDADTLNPADWLESHSFSMDPES